MPHATVLVVDDDANNRGAYAAYLRHSGYAVIEAGDGSEAVVAARRARPDVVLMDLSMPVMDGWTATRILKSDLATVAIPVVALTGHDLSVESESVRDVGFDGVPRKPCRLAEIARTVEMRIGGPRMTA